MITANPKAIEVNSFDSKSVLNAPKSFLSKLGNSLNAIINYLYDQDCWVNKKKEEK